MQGWQVPMGHYHFPATSCSTFLKAQPSCPQFSIMSHGSTQPKTGHWAVQCVEGMPEKPSSRAPCTFHLLCALGQGAFILRALVCSKVNKRRDRTWWVLGAGEASVILWAVT